MERVIKPSTILLFDNIQQSTNKKATASNHKAMTGEIKTNQRKQKNKGKAMPARSQKGSMEYKYYSNQEETSTLAIKSDLQANHGKTSKAKTIANRLCEEKIK